MKKVILAITLIAISAGALAYNARCVFDNSQGTYLGSVTMEGVQMAKYRCLLNGHIFYTRL